VNLTLVQCEFNNGNKTLIARIKSINRNLDANFRFFQKYFVLNPNFQGANARFAPPADAHKIIDYFISGSTNKASSSNQTKKRF